MGGKVEAAEKARLYHFFDDQAETYGPNVGKLDAEQKMH